MTMLLELRRVWKIYGAGPARVQALREIDLAVEGGELVAVMGPSGSGKSTLLAIAGTLEEPSSGEVLVSGSALSGMTPNQRARLRRRAIGYVFQDFNLLAGCRRWRTWRCPWSWTALPASCPCERAGRVGRAGPGRPGRPVPRRAVRR